MSNPTCPDCGGAPALRLADPDGYPGAVEWVCDNPIHAAAQAVVDDLIQWNPRRKPYALTQSLAALIALCNQPADAGGKD